MIFYDTDILHVESGQVRRTPMYVGWTEYSPRVYRETMCDCNLAGYCEAGFVLEKTGEWVFCTQPHEFAAFDFRRQFGCDHSIPPSRFRALKAYLQDGRVFDFERGQFVTVQ